jgi:gamma-tubulin complex component 3
MALPGDPRGADDIPVDTLSPNGELPLPDLSASVESAALRTNKHLVSLMMNQYALGEHCLALRRFLLLGQGDFVESLMDNAEAELYKEAKEVYKHQLMGVVDMAVRQSNAQFCPPDVLARLGVKLLPPSSGERAWDVFLLDYKIDKPLHVVFTTAAMQQYERAFAFLFKLKRSSHALSSCWSQHMALQRFLVSCGAHIGSRAPELGLEMRQTLHRCTCLRNEMHHFIQNIHSYVMCEVVEIAWAKLQAGWQDCMDLDQVILEHQRYLANIEEGAFLAPKSEPILTALSALFGLSLEFAELHDQVCSSAFEAVEVLSSDPDGPLPFARSLAECRAQLDQLGASFLVRLQSLLRALESQPSNRLLSTDLRFLLCRLDFNGYYEQKRSAPLAERIQMG